MSKSREIIELFANLALNLQTQNPSSPNGDQSTLDSSIANLNQALNLSQIPRVRVLDTALSIMCFTAPQVFESVTEHIVKTIVAVLNSSVTCKVLRWGKEEILRVGGSISLQDCKEIIEACTDVLEKLQRNEMLSLQLVRAVVRVAVSATLFQYASDLPPILNERHFVGRSRAFRKLLCHLPKETSFDIREVPLRLQIWFLDPLILKQDISLILEDITRRPFLCLNVEFYERMEWRSIILSLVISPVMFIETMALLNHWFLATGLTSILELQSELMLLLLDIISRPMWWGISAEVGSLLPFSLAYFPCQQQLLRILTGALSCKTLIHLVCVIRKMVSNTRKYSDPTSGPASMNLLMVGHKSMWYVAINFPEWFHLASALLFSTGSDKLHSECAFKVAGTEQAHVEEPSCSASAAWYIAWILNPINKSDQDLLVDCLNNLSSSFSCKQFTNGQNRVMVGHKQRLKKPKLYDKDIGSFPQDFDCSRIRLWLKEFQDMCIMYCNKASNMFASVGSSVQKNVLVRKISLGILIGSHDFTNEDGYELLHYAATGSSINHCKETPSVGTKQEKQNSEIHDIRDVVAGACLVFQITDVAEIISGSIFETEEGGVDFVWQVKFRAGRYLLECVKRLLQLKTDQDVEVLMLPDLHKRLVRWKHQGRDISQVYKDLDDAIYCLSNDN